MSYLAYWERIVKKLPSSNVETRKYHSVSLQDLYNPEYITEGCRHQ